MNIIATANISAHDLMLIDYETDYYLRVEDQGNAVLKTSLSRQGSVIKDGNTLPKTKQDLLWVSWAQNIIEKQTNAN